MKYVILRDDDTNALTPVEYLDRLYRPFLDRGMPVCLATIPNVRTDVTYGDGVPEGFLVTRNDTREKLVPIGSNPRLVQYLRDNELFYIAQHGCHHEFVGGQCEFDHHDRADLVRRFDEGTRLLMDAGFGRPETFVAPYDLMTPVSFTEAARRFNVVSTSWFEWRRLPVTWLPGYISKRIRGAPHWRVNGTALLSHPPCYLSFRKPYASMLDEISRSIESRRLTVLVTHWWEFFHENKPDESFISVLHEAAAMIAKRQDVKMVSFGDVAAGGVPIN